MLLTITIEHTKNRWVQNKTIIQEINSIVSQGKKFSTIRNHLVHGAWAYPKGGNKPDVVLCYMKEAEDKIAVTPDQERDDSLHQHNGKLKTLNQRADKLIRRLEEMQEALQQKSRAGTKPNP